MNRVLAISLVSQLILSADAVGVYYMTSEQSKVKMNMSIKANALNSDESDEMPIYIA